MLSAPYEALRCPLSSLPIASPIDAARAVPVALFGWRVSPFTGKTMAQYGVTLAASQGEPVVAPGAGRVLFAGSVRERKANEWTRLGNLVVVDHGGGVMTIYAHLRDTLVKRGQVVARAQRLGSVGQTGWTRVPALYYEVRWPVDDGSKPIDPGLVTPTVPVEDLDARLADPTGGLPGGFRARAAPGRERGTTSWPPPHSSGADPAGTYRGCADRRMTSACHHGEGKRADGKGKATERNDPPSFLSLSSLSL